MASHLNIGRKVVNFTIIIYICSEFIKTGFGGGRQLPHFFTNFTIIYD